MVRSPAVTFVVRVAFVAVNWGTLSLPLGYIEAVPAPGQVIGGRFEIIEIAAVGGMGRVFRAVDRTTGETVALKVLMGDREDRPRFTREIEQLAATAHDGVVRFISHGVTSDDEPYLVMEWVDGASLASVLETRGLTVREAVAVTGRIAHALSALHREGMVHRDLKPSNLMFEGGDLERVKIIDFGIARPIGGGRRLTMTGMVVGTPGYMSPEQARGMRQLDARADVFSLGCVLYECATGWAPFSGEHSVAVRTKIVFTQPPPLQLLAPEAPDALVALLDRMLAKKRDERPRDADEVAAAIAALPVIPEGPRRRTVDDDPPTIAMRGQGVRDFIVLAGHADGNSVTPAVREKVERAATAIDPAIEVTSLEGSTLIIRVPGDGDPEARAQLAARCARLCREHVPAAPIAIVAMFNRELVERGAQDVIDRAADGMFRSVLADSPSPVWLDDVVRAYLGELTL